MKPLLPSVFRSVIAIAALGGTLARCSSDGATGPSQ